MNRWHEIRNSVRAGVGIIWGVLAWWTTIPFALGEAPDLVVYGGQVITVDNNFTVHNAFAVRGDRILAVGDNATIRALAGPNTRRLDLQGKTVLPGLIDSHVHPSGAAVYELDHPIPVMESIDDVLNYVQQRTTVQPKGSWIHLNQVFITRLREQRFPTREELDKVAPEHPVYFGTGPDAAVNSLALKRNNIDAKFHEPAGAVGKIERHPQSREPTGIIRGAGQFIKSSSNIKSPTEAERRVLLKKLLADYNACGITSISDRNAGDAAIAMYQELRDANELNCRVFLYYAINGGAPIVDIEKRLRAAAQSTLHCYDNRLWLRGAKFFLDGGMLTGSAYMQKPWGVSAIYGISDSSYRGVRNVEPKKMYDICRVALSLDLQITAHAVGDGAVQTLVDAYELVDKIDFPIRDKRPCITHCNFLTPSAMDTMAKLGIVADLQPAWLWLDGNTLHRQFGADRLRWFQPYKTLFDKGVIVGGGSDHMQRIGGMRAVNPYNPFLGMWITLTRQARGLESPLHPQERLTRAQAIRLYTIQNAWLTFEEKHKGSLEPGKLADFIVLSKNPLTCPVDEIKELRVEQSYLGGKLVYERP